MPKSKRTNSQLVAYIPREQLKHHMILPNEVEERLLSIKQEYVARERLKNFNLVPKRKILLYGPPGCGKTLSAERIAWNLGLPLLKVRFDSLLSSYFGESASNLRMVFDYCKCYSNLNHTSAAHTTPPVTGVLPLCTRLRRVRRNNPPWRSL